MFNKNRIVGFKVGDELFGIDISKVQEIILAPEITSIPDSNEHFEGVINLRGKIVTVIDLRKKMGFSPHENSKKKKILIVESGQKIIGFIVSQVTEVLSLPDNSVEPPPEMVSSSGMEYIKGIGKLEDRIIMLLDLDKVLGKVEVPDKSKMEMAVNAASAVAQRKVAEL